jgi:hypothetical protein
VNPDVLRPHTQLAEDWMILVFVFVLLVMARSRAQNPARVVRMWNITFNVRLMRQVMREETKASRENVLYFSCFALQLSLVVYLFLKCYNLLPQFILGALIYPTLLLITVLAYGVKSVGIRAVQFLTAGNFGLDEYHYNVFLINRILAFVLLPLTMVLAYGPVNQAHYAFVAVFSLLGLAFLYRLFRGTSHAIQSGVSLFYIFFYICTLEFLPLVVCWKSINH